MQLMKKMDWKNASVIGAFLSDLSGPGGAGHPFVDEDSATSRAAKRRKGTTMDYFAGIDVAVEQSSICVIDERGLIVLETVADSHPDAIVAALKPYLKRLKRVGHETGAIAPWLHKGLAALGVPIVCMEAAHTRAALKSMRNKTDRNDARGLAQILRTGWFQPVYIKSDEAYRLRLLLTARRNLKRKCLDLDNTIRHSLKAFGVKLGPVAKGKFEARVRDLLNGDPVLESLVDGLLNARRTLLEEHLKLHNLIVRMVGHDPLMRRFTGVPGVGPITAMSFRAAVDDPHRFVKSRIVGAHFGLTPRRYQSGTSVDYGGHISKMGDANVRHTLYEAANALLTLKRGPDPIKSWGKKIAKRRGHKAACCAVARKLAVILHAMWRDGTEYGVPENTHREPRIA